MKYVFIKNAPIKNRYEELLAKFLVIRKNLYKRYIINIKK